MTTAIAGSHLQLNEEISLTETFSKMAPPTAYCYFQLHEQILLAESNGYFVDVLGYFCLLYQKFDASEVHPEHKLEKNKNIVDISYYQV